LTEVGCRAHINGACAAFVAVASRIGLRRQAWDIMLANYRHDDPNAHLWHGCFVPLVDDRCPSGMEEKFSDFPTALNWFLNAYGYGSDSTSPGEAQ